LPASNSTAWAISCPVPGRPRAELRFDVLHHALHRNAQRDIGAEDRGAAAAFANVVRDRRRLGDPLAVVYCDCSARLCERQRNRLADAA
jgi:hypothetical protein